MNGRRGGAVFRDRREHLEGLMRRHRDPIRQGVSKALLHLAAVRSGPA